MNTNELFKQIAALRKAGKTAEAFAKLRDALRRGLLDAEATDRAGRFLIKEFAAGNVEGKPLKDLLLGQCTTSWLVSSLTAVALGNGVSAIVNEGGFDSILHDLSRASVGGERPDVVALLPWSARLTHGKAPLEDRIDGELALWKQAWSIVKAGLGSRLVQVGYDWVIPGPLGHHLAAKPGGPVHDVRAMNSRAPCEPSRGKLLRRSRQALGHDRPRPFYDMRRYYWTKQPFSETGVEALPSTSGRASGP